jgi:hypothetical protein
MLRQPEPLFPSKLTFISAVCTSAKCQKRTSIRTECVRPSRKIVLANAGSFNDQQHSIGPTLFFKPGGDDDDEEVGDSSSD